MKTRFRYYISCTLVMWIALAASCGCSLLPFSDASPQDYIDLSGQWKIIESGSTGVELPGYDDSGAGTVEIPGKWEQLLWQNEDLAAVVWFRKKLYIDEKYRDNLMVLSLGPVSIADEAYINGVFVGSTGNIPRHKNQLDYDFTWHYDRNYTFSGSLIRFNSENVIVVKVFSHYLNGIKEAPRLFTVTEWNRLYWLRNYLPPINNFILLIFTLVMLFILIVVVRGKVSDLVYLYTTLFVVSVFAIYLLLLGVPDISDGLLRYKLFFINYSLIDLFLLMAIREFFKVESRWPVISVIIVALAVNILIMVSPSTRFLILYSKFAVVLFLLLCVSYSLIIFILALFRDPIRYWFIAPLALFVVISATDTYYVVLTDQMYQLSFGFIFRLIALGLGAIFYFIFDLKNIEKERDSLYRSLLKKSKDLNLARNQAVSNKKKDDPRDIIHRLIDHVDNNYSETYDRLKLAQKFCLNEDYMGQLFKKVTGTNIANYINCRRIDAAKQLLDETDSKVIDIAFHVGFDNLTYFYRHFKKKTGFNPTEYRKMKRNSFVKIEFGEYDEPY